MWDFAPIGGGGGGGGAGGSPIPWTKLTAVTEASGIPNDPSSLAGTGTGFSSSRFRHVWPTTTAIHQSYRSTDTLWWSYPLLTLYPDFDPELHVLQLCADLSTANGNQLGQGVADGAGVFVGLADEALSSASVNASIVGLCRSGASAHQARKLNTTSSTSGGTVVNGDQIYQTIEFQPVSSAWRPCTTANYRDTGAVTVSGSTLSPNFETLSTTLANWRLVTGGFDINGTDPAGLDVRWEVYHRRLVKASGLVA